MLPFWGPGDEVWTLFGSELGQPSRHSTVNLKNRTLGGVHIFAHCLQCAVEVYTHRGERFACDVLQRSDVLESGAFSFVGCMYVCTCVKCLHILRAQPAAPTAAPAAAPAPAPSQDRAPPARPAYSRASAHQSRNMFRGNHLANTTCLTHFFFNTYEQCSKFN